jgi:hypothetical protein
MFPHRNMVKLTWTYLDGKPKPDWPYFDR